MTSVSMFEAKTNLSKYVASLVEQRESSVVILKNGKPVARIIPYESDEKKRIGIAKDKLPVMPELSEFNSVDVESDFLSDGGLL